MAYRSILNKLKKKGIKPGLSRTVAVLNTLDKPQNSYDTIHVAGTNGKGSTCTIIAQILKENGFKVGLYTSPELISFNDRIKVNGVMIDDQFIENFFDKNMITLTKNNVSHFEAVTCLAFNYFRERGVDIAVLETGMGGRFDATNIVLPKVFAITNISEDHKEFLGNTIKEIAREKAGIIKPGIKGAIGKQNQQAFAVLQKIAQQKQANIYYAPDNINIKIKSSTDGTRILDIDYNNINLDNVRFKLIGEFQIENLKTALQAISLLDYNLTPSQIKAGIEKTVLKGRMELVNKKPMVFYDVGHNPGAIQEVLNTIKNITDKTLNVVIALKKSKDSRKIGELLTSVDGKVYLYTINRSEFYSSKKLYDIWKSNFPDMNIDIIKNMKIIRKINGNKEQIWLITGTHSLAKDVYQSFKLY